MTGEQSRESGIGLVELLVTMMIGSVLLLCIGVTFSSTLRTSGQVTARVNSTADARIAMDAMARRLRVAVRPAATRPMFEAGQVRADSVTFYASLLPGSTGGAATSVSERVVVIPTRVRYWVQDGCLHEGLTPGRDALAGGWEWVAPESSRCLAPGPFTRSDGTFTYYPAGLGVAPLPLVGGALPDDQHEAVRRVGLSVEVGRVGAAELETSRATTEVTLINGRLDDLGGRTP